MKPSCHQQHVNVLDSYRSPLLGIQMINPFRKKQNDISVYTTAPAANFSLNILGPSAHARCLHTSAYHSPQWLFGNICKHGRHDVLVILVIVDIIYSCLFLEEKLNSVQAGSSYHQQTMIRSLYFVIDGHRSRGVDTNNVVSTNI